PRQYTFRDRSPARRPRRKTLEPWGWTSWCITPGEMHARAFLCQQQVLLESLLWPQYAMARGEPERQSVPIGSPSTPKIVRRTAAATPAVQGAQQSGRTFLLAMQSATPQSQR